MTYTSVKEAALAAGVHESTLYKVRRKNPDKDIKQCIELIGTHGGKRRRKSKIREKADELGVCYRTFKYRVDCYGLDKAVEMGNKKLRRGVSKGTRHKHIPIPIEQIKLPETDEYALLKNLIKSLKSMGFNDSQIIQEVKKRQALI